MKKFIGTVAAMAILGLAAGAQAQGDISGSGSGGSGSMGGSTGSTGSQGSMGQMGSESMGQQQLEGKVLKADKNNITIEHMGAAIPLSVGSSTSFQGVKSAKDIKEGQQVRASFSLKGTKNELTSVEVLPGSTGGTGSYGGGSSGSSGSDTNKGGY